MSKPFDNWNELKKIFSSKISESFFTNEKFGGARWVSTLDQSKMGGMIHLNAQYWLSKSLIKTYSLVCL